MPIIINALMGLMMMWILHGVLTEEGGVTGWALITFVAGALHLDVYRMEAFNVWLN